VLPNTKYVMFMLQRALLVQIVEVHTDTESPCTQSCRKFCYNFHVVWSWRQWGGRVV